MCRTIYVFSFRIEEGGRGRSELPNKFRLKKHSDVLMSSLISNNLASTEITMSINKLYIIVIKRYFSVMHIHPHTNTGIFLQIDKGSD